MLSVFGGGRLQLAMSISYSALPVDGFGERCLSNVASTSFDLS